MNFYANKNNFLACLFCLILIFNFSCGKDPVGFEMNYRNAININAGLNTVEIHNFVINDILSDTVVYFTANRSSSSRISTILPKTFNIKDNSGVDLNFVTKAEVIISSKTNPNATPTVIYYRDDVPFNNNNSIDMIASNVDLRPFLYQNKYDMKLRLWLRSVTQVSITPEVTWSFLAQTN
jgi:hypothetical protein